MRALPLLLLLIAAPAAAAPIVVLPGSSGQGPAPEASTVLATARSLLDGEEFEVVAPLPLALGLDDPLYALGLELAGCDGRPVTRETVSQGLTHAREAVDELDYAAARLMLAGAGDVLPCLTEAVDRSDLYDIWFLAGLMAYYEQDEPAAEAAFVRATGVDATRPWNPAYAPDAKGIFLVALQKALAEAGPTLRLSDDLAGLVHLDGSVLESGIRPTAGSHLVQWTGPDGEVLSFEIDLPTSSAGAVAWLMGPEGLEAAILEGRADLAGLFAERIGILGWERVLLLDERGGAVRFDARAGEFSQEAWPVVEQPVAPGPVRASPTAPTGSTLAGLVTLGAGAALGGVGFGLHGSAWQRGHAMLADPTLGTAGDYQGLQQENLAGLVVGLTGAAVATAGLVVALGSAAQANAGPKAGTSARSVTAPWVVGGPGGVAIGVGGTW
jgi:hypothetical protein